MRVFLTIRVGQQMMIYPNEEAARSAFDKIVAQSFPAEYVERVDAKMYRASQLSPDAP